VFSQFIYTIPIIDPNGLSSVVLHTNFGLPPYYGVATFVRDMQTLGLTFHELFPGNWRTVACGKMVGGAKAWFTENKKARDLENLKQSKDWLCQGAKGKRQVEFEGIWL
jgi:hypothetical protein